MANAVFETGRNFFADGTINAVTGLGGAGALQAALMTYTVPTAGIKAITGATTGAGAAALTVTAHGFANGDVIIVSGVGGTTTANNMWVVSGQTTNAFNLVDPITAVQGTLVGAYTSGGVAINLGPSFGTWASFSGALIGTAVKLTSVTEVQGIVSAASTTFTAVSGAAVSAIAILATASSVSGTLASTDKMVAWIDGQMVVTCAAALAAGTVLPVERLAAAIPNSTVLAFSDGTSATINGAPAAFARTITVTSTTVAAAARASAPATASGLPVTPNGGNITVAWDSVGSQHVGIFKL